MTTRKLFKTIPLLMMMVALAVPSTATAQDDPDALWRAGLQALQDGNPQGCVDNLRSALRAGGEAYERWGWIHKTLGICLGQRNMRDEAISELQTARELITADSDHFETNHALAQIYMGRGNSGDYDRAIAAENDAAQYAADANQRALVAKTLGQAYYFKEDWRNAITHLGTAAAARTTDADIAQKLGRSYMEAGDDAQAKTWFEKTLQLDRSNVSAITNLGRLAVDSQDWATAVQFLTRGVQANPQNMTIRSLLGRAHIGAGDYDAAVQQLSQVVQSEPTNGTAHYNLGQANQAAGNDAGAIDAFSNALRHLADGTQTRAECLYDLGFMYEKVGRYDDSLAALEDSAGIRVQAKTTEAIERVKERIRREKSGS